MLRKTIVIFSDVDHFLKFNITIKNYKNINKIIIMKFLIIIPKERKSSKKTQKTKKHFYEIKQFLV